MTVRRWMDQVERALWIAVVNFANRRMKGIWLREHEREGWVQERRWVRR